MSTLAWLGFTFAVVFTVAWLAVLLWDSIDARRAAKHQDREPGRLGT
jgi:hypothetical protein